MSHPELWPGSYIRKALAERFPEFLQEADSWAAAGESPGTTLDRITGREQDNILEVLRGVLTNLGYTAEDAIAANPCLLYDSELLTLVLLFGVWLGQLGLAKIRPVEGGSPGPLQGLASCEYG